MAAMVSSVGPGWWPRRTIVLRAAGLDGLEVVVVKGLCATTAIVYTGVKQPVS